MAPKRKQAAFPTLRAARAGRLSRLAGGWEPHRSPSQRPLLRYCRRHPPQLLVRSRAHLHSEPTRATYGATVNSYVPRTCIAYGSPYGSQHQHLGLTQGGWGKGHSPACLSAEGMDTSLPVVVLRLLLAEHAHDRALSAHRCASPASSETPRPFKPRANPTSHVGFGGHLHST